MQYVSALEEIVGPGNVSNSASVCQTYSYSCFLGSDWVAKPDLVVIARTPEQVSQILKFANQHGIPVTPRGAAGQGGHGGPLKGGILLDLTPMEKIITIDK
jgi:glycolate oxidase